MRIPHTVTTALSGAAAALLLVAAPAAAATPPRAQVPALIAPEPVGGGFAQQPDDTGCGAGRFAVVCPAPPPGSNAVPGAARNALSAELRAHGSSSTRVPSVRPPSARGPAGQIPPAARRVFVCVTDCNPCKKLAAGNARILLHLLRHSGIVRSEAWLR